MGGSSVQLEIKKIGKHIFIHYFITFLGEHSNVNNVINALLGPYAFVLASMYRYSWLMTFEIFRNFLFLDRGVGGWGVSYPIFLGIFNIFFIYLQGPLVINHYNISLIFGSVLRSLVLSKKGHNYMYADF